jgi:hypothetical protein
METGSQDKVKNSILRAGNYLTGPSGQEEAEKLPATVMTKRIPVRKWKAAGPVRLPSDKEVVRKLLATTAEI